MAEYAVYLTPDAEADLEEIADYVERRDSPERGDYVYGRIKEAILALERLPNRGRVVPELKEVGVTRYREIIVKPYRVLYLVRETEVHVYCISDGRRSAEDGLGRRFLR